MWRFKHNKKQHFSLEDEYEIRKDLGQGAFSVVREVHHIGAEEGLNTAVKITPLEVYRKNFGLDREALDRRLSWLKRENNKLNSPYINRLIAYELSDHDCFVFLDLYEGPDLFERITTAPGGHLTEQEARLVTRNLLIALDSCNEVGVMHRDVRSFDVSYRVQRSTRARSNVRKSAITQSMSEPRTAENVMYRHKDSHIGDVVLVDFGNCIEKVDPNAFYLGHSGSPGYMAPEMAAGKPYNSKVDIFSLGVLTYEALTGRSPFPERADGQLTATFSQGQAPFPRRYWEKISTEARDCVHLMLQTDPRLRWTANELLSHPWFDNIDEDRSIVSAKLPYVQSPLSSATSSQVSALSRTSASGTSQLSDSDDEGHPLRLMSTTLVSKLEGLTTTVSTAALLTDATTRSKHASRFAAIQS